MTDAEYTDLKRGESFNDLWRKLKRTEKRLAMVTEKQEALQSETYDLRVSLYRLRGRCYPCEAHAGMKPGDCSGASTKCLRPWRRPVNPY